MLSLAERDWRDGGLGVWAEVEVVTTVGTGAEGLVVGMIGSGSGWGEWLLWGAAEKCVYIAVSGR